MNKHSSIHINKQIIGSILAAFFCAAGMVLGQAPSVPPHGLNGSSHRLPPELIARFTKQARLDQAARAAFGARDYEAAEKYARQSLALGEGTGLNQEILADALDNQGKDEEALPIYEVMYKAGETSPDYVLPYAMLLLKSGQWAQAVAAYNRALPYLNEGDLVRAHNDFAPTVPRPKELATALHVGLGMAYISSSDIGGRLQNDKALLHFRQALALAPNNSLANYQFGVALARIGRTIEAKAAFKKATQIGQSDEEQADVKRAAQAALR